MMMGVAQVMGMKPILRSRFSGAPAACAMASRAVAERKHALDGGDQRARAEQAQHGAAGGVVGEDRLHHRDFGGLAQRAGAIGGRGVRGIAGEARRMRAAAAAGVQACVGRERVLEDARHGSLPRTWPNWPFAHRGASPVPPIESA